MNDSGYPTDDTDAPPEARFYLKVPRTYFSRILRRGRGKNVEYVDNPEFLNAEAYRREFRPSGRGKRPRKNSTHSIAAAP